MFNNQSRDKSTRLRHLESLRRFSAVRPPGAPQDIQLSSCRPWQTVMHSFLFPVAFQSSREKVSQGIFRIEFKLIYFSIKNATSVIPWDQ